MSGESMAAAGGCEEFDILMTAHFDGETTPADEARLQAHIAGCPSCARRFAQYEKLFAATREVVMRPAPREAWDLYWSNVYNRLERKVAWIAVSVGLAAGVLYALARLGMLLVQDQHLPAWVKVAVGATVAGFTLLFVSVLREKMAMCKVDKYRGVLR